MSPFYSIFIKVILVKLKLFKIISNLTFKKSLKIIKMSKFNLKVEKFNETSHQNENLGCQICHLEFQPQDKICILFCGDIFHENCIKFHFIKKTNCPVCRRPVSGDRIGRPQNRRSDQSHNRNSRSRSRRRQSMRRGLSAIRDTTSGLPSPQS